MDDSTLLSLLLVGISGFAFGFLLAYFMRGGQVKNAEQVARQIFEESEKRREANENAVIDTVKVNFKSLSLDSLKESGENLLTLAEERLKRQSEQHTSELDSKKGLIDQQLEVMTQKLGEVTKLVNEFEEKRAEKLGALGNELDKLTRTSSLLQQALADNRSRGQWGERIAEDILRIAGFIEGVNYTKQNNIETGDRKKSRPDFTFTMPNGMSLNMDSKFPLDNYLSFLSAEAETDKDSYRKKFLSDIKHRVKEISDRGYISVEQNTLDCVLIFIPNEQIYRFIHEHDDKIIDDAMNNKVIICSPLTLYIVLAVIRQATENFRLEKASRDILLLLNEFKKQWGDYVKKMDDMGSSLAKAQDAFEELIGKRQKGLEKPLKKIDGLLAQNGIEETGIEIAVAS
jgi:DNA recombination protein RmuC